MSLDQVLDAPTAFVHEGHAAYPVPPSVDAKMSGIFQCALFDRTAMAILALTGDSFPFPLSKNRVGGEHVVERRELVCPAGT